MDCWVKTKINISNIYDPIKAIPKKKKKKPPNVRPQNLGTKGERDLAKTWKKHKSNEICKKDSRRDFSHIGFGS